MSDYQPKHRAEGPAVAPLKHDTIKHVLKGSLGTHVPGCPRCEEAKGEPPFIRHAAHPFKAD